ncbi:MAG: ATP phosphoribosyltransferase regulatory subunit [Gammaproteobacteria bacterium]|nr:MAG: ATP phosphoribosyltransferase regulatory subunit [Gammaproteobacteria bacterium]
MSETDKWLLPEGIEEVLPPDAWRLECARRELLDLFKSWGYELIMPPFIEYLESLLTGTGNDLDLQTFKLTDQLTGRMLGVRADMTPQAARIDAHAHRREAPTRLCYMGTVLHTRPDGFAGSRSPLQVGAELFGHAGFESDVEILTLVLESLGRMQVSNVHVDLGHVGIFRSLATEAGLDARQETALFDALQRKAVTEISAILDASNANGKQRDRLAVLAELNGGQEVLETARARLAGAGEEVMAALDNLNDIATAMQQRAGNTQMFFDLAELRGYRFHTGMVFAIFVPGRGQEIARGGRYDAIGQVFGRSRAATGFSMDLKTLMDLSPRDPGVSTDTILAPADLDPELLAAVSRLRDDGERVVFELPGQKGDAAEQRCSRVLKKQNGSWVVDSV